MEIIESRKSSMEGTQGSQATTTSLSSPTITSPEVASTSIGGCISRRRKRS